MSNNDLKQLGEKLALELENYKDDQNVVILALPNGGIELGKHVSDSLNVPFEFIFVLEITVPDDPQFPIGAVGEKEISLKDDDIIRMYNLSSKQVIDGEEQQTNKIENMKQELRDGKDIRSLNGKTVIILDDNIERRYRIEVAIMVAKRVGANKCVVAAPVASRRAIADIKRLADEWICLEVTQSPVRAGATGISNEGDVYTEGEISTEDVGKKPSTGV